VTSERLMSWASITVMALAIVANVRKAADVMIGLGRPGSLLQSWDAILAAVALEAGFALFAFFMAREIQGKRRYMALLVSGTLVMGAFSAVANIAYYTKYSPAAALSWQWWQSVILGLSAPSVAIMTAVLAGVVVGIQEISAREEVDLVRQGREQELRLAKEKTAQERARARAEKARSSGNLPATAGRVGVVSGNGRMTPERLLREHPEAAGWTGRQIAEAAGVSARTGRNWARKLKERGAE